MESKEKSIGGHRMMLQKQVEDMGMASERHKGIGYMGKGSMEGDIVIILAALLCALICALGLNSMVRCALRCSRRLSSESEEEISARLANKGMKKKALKALPTSVYVAPTKQEGQQQHQAFECPICLGEFEDGQKVRVLPMCNHAFHVACIDTWLLSHSSCPTCRSCLTLLQHHHAIDIAMGRLDREDGTCSSLSTSSSHHHHHIVGMLEAALPSLQGHSPSHPH